jgi:hypothetical protein
VCNLAKLHALYDLKIDGKIKNTFLMYLVDVEMLAEVKMPSAFLRILIFIIT